MIELDDVVGSLNLGINEYVVLKALDINRIRQFLLLDVERIVAVQDFDKDVHERLSAWQGLLRKYLTYDKIHEARNNDGIAKEALTIHEPLSKTKIGKAAITKFEAKGIVTICDLLDLEEEDLEALDKGLLESVELVRSELCNKELVDKVVQEALLEVYSARTTSMYSEPEATIGTDDFVDQPIGQSGINPNELEILRTLKIATVKEFLEMDISRTYEVKGYPERTYHRLHSWQKYLGKRLHFLETNES